MDVTYTDVMHDIETTGVSPDHSGMIQIAAVRFNIETGEVDPNVFSRCLAMAPGRYWDESTRDFWMKKNVGVYRQIVAQMEDPATVMASYIEWARAVPDVRFWSKPLSFDWPIIASHCRQFGHEMPFFYRHARDVNTFIASRKGLADHVDMSHIEMNGPAHEALTDCVYQIKCLFAARDGVWA